MKPGSWRDIQGWFDEGDEPAMRVMVEQFPDAGKYVEVGVWKGRSIAAFHAFLSQSGKTARIYAVDTFEGSKEEPCLSIHREQLQADGWVPLRQQFEENMQALGIIVHLDVFVIQQESAKAAEEITRNGNLDMVFIDAEHTREAVMRDIQAWYPKLREGGLLAGHDLDQDGVQLAVRAIFGDSFHSIGRIWMVVKKTT